MAGQPVIFGAGFQAADQEARKGACGWTVSHNHGQAGYVGDPDEAVEEREVGDGV